MILQANGDPVGTRRDTVESLIQECLVAAERMSVKNPHRDLMLKCAQAVTDLTKQLHTAQTRLVHA